MEYVDWFWQLIPESGPALQAVTVAIFVAFAFVLVLAIVTSFATIRKGQPPWRWGGYRERRPADGP